MIKDILANLSVTEEEGPAGDYAVSVAAALRAHLTGIAFIYDPVIPASGTGYIPAEVIESQEADNETAAKTAIKKFLAATDRSGTLRLTSKRKTGALCKLLLITGDAAPAASLIYSLPTPNGPSRGDLWRQEHITVVAISWTR